MAGVSPQCCLRRKLSGLIIAGACGFHDHEPPQVFQSPRLLRGRGYGYEEDNFPAEVRVRTVRMVRDHQGGHASQFKVSSMCRILVDRVKILVWAENGFGSERLFAIGGLLIAQNRRKFHENRIAQLGVHVFIQSAWFSHHSTRAVPSLASRPLKCNSAHRFDPSHGLVCLSRPGWGFEGHLVPFNEVST